MKTRIINMLPIMLILLLAGCNSGDKKLTEEMKADLTKYKEVTLTTDLSWLSSQEREIISILIDVAGIMDDVFWKEAYGDKEELFTRIDNEYAKDFSKINYGPWDRLDNDAPFIPGFGSKLPAAKFYPGDMTVEEFESWDNPDKTGLYTIIKRDTEGKLIAVPYYDAFKEQHSKAANLMLEAADLAEDAGLKKYLKIRADALLTNQYQLFGYKAAHESFVLVKDPVWSAQLEKFNAMLPGLQANLPVTPEYKAEMPGTNADMNVYDAIYLAGDCNAGSKTIAINLPNDPEVQLAVGSRKLQLKNAMKAKFDNILMPVAGMMIDGSQRKYITFDAFFENTTFHEVAHGLEHPTPMARQICFV
jgi:hypothetical protein